ncbi:Uncharacterized [Syntrophomonas zehnderi OL-4]|uniref:Uncharacterized n=1 Tax=Syntrophomonas zehnderi OL-4 TaxID=690567 RepID=A0A0E4G965_9FIRM|nr:hypothetical protein [Syntrophomonas zehnderi]CFX06831.1 Uncharacterized [Syntrophomonas zehnderi OL-4]CFX32807.1 Uncharacterized [Syntrophomonas zehnderi OL-4]
MSILSDLNDVLEPLHIPIETGVFSGVPPDEYLVFIPLTDIFEVYADNRPGFDVQEVRISIFSKGNYQQRKRQITTALVNADFTITERRYIGHEDDTGYHHYVIDVAKNYGLEE